MHKPAKGVAHMKLNHSSLKLAAIAVLATLAVGCQSDRSAHWHLPGLRRTPDCQCRPQYAAAQPDYSFENTTPHQPLDDYGIHPGHSIDSPEEYAPTPTAEPMYPAPPAPAPMPRADELSPRGNPDIPGSEPPSPLLEEAVRLKNGPVPPQENQVHDVGEPDRLSPFSVRSIYEKLRPKTSEPAEIEDGPIANNQQRQSTTRVVDYRNVSTGHVGDQPVTLGMPETEESPFGGFTTEYTPSVMQATPSSYRHPMLADPTGMPYGGLR
ncbi:MAG: hypothetical protein KDA52_06700 [Planctomycetaceae bacterium]|nr:hypothetical protein [Planctomycetaceae bacterium]